MVINQQQSFVQRFVSDNRKFILGDDWIAGKDLEASYQTRASIGSKPERPLSEIPGTKAYLDAYVPPSRKEG